jgi:protocatechuate 3,4-dioxygenase beta subunit
MYTFLLSLLFFFAAPAQETTAQNPADLCTIQGVVVKAGTGEPLSEATVEARPLYGHTRGMDTLGDVARDAVTDAMGRFELKGLPPGRYILRARRDGFLRQEYSQSAPDGPRTLLTLSSGQKISGITFQFIPGAVIAGHVFDQDGKPVAKALVSLRGYNGQRQLVESRGMVTDDQGEFRFTGLSPGQYILEASSPEGLSKKPKTRQGYVPTYYPGVLDAEAAAPITVRAGDEFSGADISLQPVDTVAVRGHVINAECGGTPRVYLFRQNSDALNLTAESLIESGNGQGAFELPTVPPGSYYVIAEVRKEEKRCVGYQPLEVSDANIDGVTLTVTLGVEIRGHLRVEGQPDSNPRSFVVILSPKTANYAIWNSYDDFPHDTGKSDGSFLLKNAVVGDYEIDAYPNVPETYFQSMPENYYVKSARLEGVDVLTAGVTVGTQDVPGSLEIVVSLNGATLDGVISQDHQPFPKATVALVPDPPYRAISRLFKSDTTDQNGHFFLQGIAPGNYKVFAWERIERDAYTSSEFLRPFEIRGVSIHVTEGSHNSVQVDLIPAKDSGQ